VARVSTKIQEIDEALQALPQEFPAYKKHGYKIAGFVWFQGWNDMYDEKARSEYKDNLVNLIKDVRKAVKVPNLPVVIGELGNGGEKTSKNMQRIRDAQAAAAEHQEFFIEKMTDNPRQSRKVRTVAFVKTTSFARRPWAEGRNSFSVCRAHSSVAHPSFDQRQSAFV
jgi:hypothetical protein